MMTKMQPKPSRLQVRFAGDSAPVLDIDLTEPGASFWTDFVRRSLESLDKKTPGTERAARACDELATSIRRARQDETARMLERRGRNIAKLESRLVDLIAEYSFLETLCEIRGAPVPKPVLDNFNERLNPMAGALRILGFNTATLYCARGRKPYKNRRLEERMLGMVGLDLGAVRRRVLEKLDELESAHGIMTAIIKRSHRA